MTSSIYMHAQSADISRLDWLMWSRRILTSMALLLLVFALLPGILRVGGIELVAVNGGSMGQAVPDNSVVVTQATNGASLRVDDVVVFGAGWLDTDFNTANVVHRLSLIVPTPEGRFGYTTGDTNMIADPTPISLDGELSLVKAVVPYVGAFYAVSSNVIFFGVVGMLLLIALTQHFKFFSFDSTSAKKLNEHEPALI